MIPACMTHESLVNEDWTRVVSRLGGAAQLEVSARETKAFVRRREIPDAVALLRLMLAYCLGERGLRSTAAWAASVGLADLSSVALFYRLRQCGDWFAVLVEGLLAAATPKASRGRLIRIIDGTTVPKAGPAARKKSELWRIHSAFDLPYERFGHFELTDQQEGETFDRMIDSPIADMKNVGPREGGSITAAQFILRFVENGTSWAHIDMAGKAWADKATNTYDKGATGFGVRLLDQYVADVLEG